MIQIQKRTIGKCLRQMVPLLLLTVVFIFQMLVGCAELGILNNKAGEDKSLDHIQLFGHARSDRAEATDVKEDLIQPLSARDRLANIEYIEPKLLETRRNGSHEKVPFYTELVKDSDADLDISLDFVGGVTVPELIAYFSDPSILNFQFSIDKAVAGDISIQLQAKMKRSEVWCLLERLLWMNGAFLAYRDGIVWVRPLPEMVTDPYISLNDSTPTNVTVRVFRLKTVEAKSVLESLKVFLSKGGFMTEIQGHNALLVIDTDNNLKKLAGIIAEIDQISDTDWYRALFPIENMSPTRLNSELEQILTILGFPVTVTAVGGSGSKSTTSSSSSPKFGAIRMVPIDRIQAMIVMAANKEAIAEVAQWVRLLDASDHAGQEQIYVYEVINGKASELAQTLGAMFTMEISTINAVTNSLTDGQARKSDGASSGGTRAQSSGNTTGSSNARKAAEKSSESGPASVFDIPCICLANDETNRLTFKAPPQVYAMIKAVLSRIDTVTQQVQLQVIVSEVSLSEGENLGSSYNLKKGDNLLRSNFANTYVPPTISGASTTGTTSTTTPASFPSGFTYLIEGENGSAAFSAGKQKGRVEVLANPTLMVVNNKTARINVGTSEPISTGTQTDGSGSGSYSTVMNTSIQYRDVGVILTVTPRVTRGGLIQLDFIQEVSQVSKSSVTSSASNFSPAFETRKIETTFSLRDGATLIVGGLIQNKKNDTVSSLPILADIPVLNFLGGSTTKSRSRTELVILITGNIVNEENPLEETVRRYTHAINVVREERDREEKLEKEEAKRANLRRSRAKDNLDDATASESISAVPPETTENLKSIGYTDADEAELRATAKTHGSKPILDTVTPSGAEIKIEVIDTAKKPNGVPDKDLAGQKR